METSSRTFFSTKRRHHVGYKERKRIKVSDISSKHGESGRILEEVEFSNNIKENDYTEDEEEERNDDDKDDKTKCESEAGSEGDGWRRVDSLPAGWTLRKSRTKVIGLENVCYVRDPNGKSFQGRRAALKYMIEKGADVDEIEIMRSMLDYEGWHVSELLPEGWRLKTEGKSADSSLLFLSQHMNLLKGSSQAESHMVADGSYSQLDLANLRAIQAEHSRTVRETTYEWKEKEELPSGWKERRTERGRVFLLAPNGETQFLSKRLALQHLIQQGRPEEDRSKMREAMGVDGWHGSRLLPAGWMFKEGSNANTAKKQTLELLSSEGAHFKSYKMAIEYMNASYTYNDEDIRGIQFLVEELSGARRTRSCEFLEKEDLPQGWKSKLTSCGKEFFISPDGRQFVGQRHVLQHLINSNSPNEEVLHQMFLDIFLIFIELVFRLK